MRNASELNYNQCVTRANIQYRLYYAEFDAEDFVRVVQLLAYHQGKVKFSVPALPALEKGLEDPNSGDMNELVTRVLFPSHSPSVLSFDAWNSEIANSFVRNHIHFRILP